MRPHFPAATMLGLAFGACANAPAPVVPVAPSTTAALVAAMTATAVTVTGKLPSHAEILKVYLAFDRTRNGALGPNEWRQASLGLFEAVDRNRDGVIERGELGNNAMIREAFPSFDEAGDGRLTKAEFLERRETIFRAADIDQDNYLTFVEYELLVLLRRTGWNDRDRNGRIAMSELDAALARAFAFLDANRDGALAGDEPLLFSPASRAAMDPKQTGRITAEQLINGYRFLFGADQVNRNLVGRAVPLFP